MIVTCNCKSIGLKNKIKSYNTNMLTPSCINVQHIHVLLFELVVFITIASIEGATFRLL
jgi:hypothetical protein